MMRHHYTQQPEWLKWKDCQGHVLIKVWNNTNALQFSYIIGTITEENSLVASIKIKYISFLTINLFKFLNALLKNTCLEKQARQWFT